MKLSSNELIKKYPIALVMTGMSIISFPFFLSNMKNPISTLLFFVIWSLVTSFSNEFLINKFFSGKIYYNKAKFIFGISQTLLNVIALAVLLFLFRF